MRPYAVMHLQHAVGVKGCMGNAGGVKAKPVSRIGDLHGAGAHHILLNIDVNRSGQHHAGRLALDMVIQVENLHQHAHLVVRQQATLIGRQIGGRQFAGDHSMPPLNSQLSTCLKSQDALHMRPASRFTPDI